MAEKFTLLELHLHAEDNEFKSDMDISSDVGDLLRRRLGIGGASDEEDTDLDERTPIETTADGGETEQVDEGEAEGSGAVVEIDADTDVAEDDEDDEDAEESSGRSKTKLLFTVLLLVGIALLAKRYLDADELEDEFEDEFEEL